MRPPWTWGGAMSVLIFAASIIYPADAQQASFGATLRILGASHKDNPSRKTRSQLRYTCGAAAHVLLRADFNKPQAVSCKRPVFGFKAERSGRKFYVTVSSVTGKIVSVTRIR